MIRDARDAAKHPTVLRTDPQQRLNWPRVSIVPRLRNLELDIKWTAREEMEDGRIENVVFVCPLPMQVVQGREGNKGIPYKIRENVSKAKTDVLVSNCSTEKKLPKSVLGRRQ